MEKRLFDEPPRIGAVPLLFAVRVSSTAPDSKSHLAAIVCLAVTQQTAALPAWYLRWPAKVTFIITKPAASREIAGWSLRTRFLRRSTARGGQSRNHTLQLERIRLYKENRCVLGGALEICKALNALSPTPGTSARVRRDERDEGGELLHECLRAPTTPASLRAKCCLHHPNRLLWDAPREGCACERADPARAPASPRRRG